MGRRYIAHRLGLYQCINQQNWGNGYRNSMTKVTYVLHVPYKFDDNQSTEQC